MTAKELRIGNLLYGADPSSIVVVNLDILNLLDKHPNIAEPIPLTPEILEKCGFEKRNKKGLPCYGDGILEFNYYDNVIIDSIGKPIKYLHQLQNLYFVLTGEELEVNL